MIPKEFNQGAHAGWAGAAWQDKRANRRDCATPGRPSGNARAPGHRSLTQVSAPPVMSRTSAGGARWGAPSDTSDRTARLKPPPAPAEAPFAPALQAT